MTDSHLVVPDRFTVITNSNSIDLYHKVVEMYTTEEIFLNNTSNLSSVEYYTNQNENYTEFSNRFQLPLWKNSYGIRCFYQWWW